MTLKDLDFVISVLKGGAPNAKPDWHSVTGFLMNHRVAGLFYSRAEKQGVTLPKKTEKLLGEIFEKQKRRTEFMRGYIDEITAELVRVGAAHIALKGSVLTNLSEREIYADGERISNDIDILVKPDGIAAACAALKKLGYAQGTYDGGKIKEFTRSEILKRRMNRGETAPFIKLTGNAETPFIEVDINFSLGNVPGEGAELINEMINSADVYNGKARVSVPDEELFFLHLVMHQYKESNLLFTVERGKDSDLYKLADIYYFIKADALDFGRLTGLVEKYGLQREVGAVAAQVGEVFKDKEILRFAENYGAAQPYVIDYEKKKKYKWNAGVRKRICRFSPEKYLTEVRE